MRERADGILRRAFWLATLAIAGFIGGCRSSGSSALSGRLEFWTLSLKPTYTDYVEGMRTAFERQNPGERVEWLDLPQNILMLKLLASLAAGMPPNLVNLGTAEGYRLAENGALQSVDGITTERDRARYFPQFWDAVQVDGKHYCIPWYVSIQVLMFNKGIFRAAGLDVTHPPRSWDDIEQAARAIRKTGNYGFLPVIRIVEDWEMDGLPILDATRRRAAFATPAHAARLAWYARLYKDDLIPRETLTGGYSDAIRRFKEGRLGMLMTGPQFLLTVHQDAPDVYAQTGVAMLPRGKAGIVPAAVMHFFIPAGTQNAAEAARLGLFLTDAANQLALCKMVPLVPSAVEAARNPFFTHGAGKNTLDDEAIRLDAEQLPYARDLNPALPHQDLLNRLLRDEVEKAVYGRVSALDALRQAARDWDEVLGQPH